jgi:hypothetical protein
MAAFKVAALLLALFAVLAHAVQAANFSYLGAFQAAQQLWPCT